MATERKSGGVMVGSGEYRYQADNTWHQLPAGWELIEAVGAATDSRDRVYVFNRGEHPLMIFEADGRFVDSWGEGRFVRPHGIWIDRDDFLYLSDDLDHIVGKYTPDGELMMTLGSHGKASDSGVKDSDYRTILRGAPPFNQPTNLAVAPDGTLYISDGYGNARVHRFLPDGKLLNSWGEPGTGPGEFNVPHGIDVDSSGRVFVADRENSRVQIFSPSGEFLEEWTDVVRPCDFYIDREHDDTVYICELGYHAGVPEPLRHLPGGRVSIFTRDGELLCRFGGNDHPGEPGDFVAPHDIWLDSRGDVYVTEVVYSAAIRFGFVAPGCHTLQKFTRVKH